MIADEGNRKSPSPLSLEQTRDLLQAITKLFQRGDLAQADALCGRILSNNSLNFDATFYRGMIARKLGDLREAEKFLLRALKIRNDFAPTFSSYGLVLHDLKRFDEALVQYEKSITLDPGFNAAYYNAGITLERLGRPEAALSFYDNAISINSDHFDFSNNRGNILKALNRVEESLKSYERAIVLKPDYSAAYNNRGVALKDLNRLEDATSHSGRRTFITNLAAKGIGVRVLAELATHSSIATTQRYIDVNDEQLRAAVELA